MKRFDSKMIYNFYLCQSLSCVLSRNKGNVKMSSTTKGKHLLLKTVPSLTAFIGGWDVTDMSTRGKKDGIYLLICIVCPLLSSFSTKVESGVLKVRVKTKLKPCGESVASEDQSSETGMEVCLQQLGKHFKMSSNFHFIIC